MVQILIDLNDRSQFVSVIGFKSDYKTIKYGKGSSRPFAFLNFHHELNISIKHSESFHFADDTSLSNINDLVQQINKVVNKDLSF